MLQSSVEIDSLAEGKVLCIRQYRKYAQLKLLLVTASLAILNNKNKDAAFENALTRMEYILIHSPFFL